MPEDLPTTQDSPAETIVSPSGSRNDETKNTDVFISYRVKSDSIYAKAFKRLLENSITPSPRVFVSNEGGLRPSSAIFNTQIQNALSSCSAVVGIIGENTLESNWVIFEAGAAFGRRCTYVPLLVGTSASDLPSMIQPYQAINAYEKDEVERLVEELANTLQSQSNFHGARFKSFVNSLGGQDNESSPDTIEQARQAHKNGNHAQAQQLLDQAEQEAEDDPGKFASVVLARCMLLEKSDASHIETIEQRKHVLQETQFGRQVVLLLDPSMTRKESFIRSNFERQFPDPQADLIEDWSEFLRSAGKDDEADKTLITMATNPHISRTSQATALAELAKSDIITAGEKLLLWTYAVDCGYRARPDAPLDFLRNKEFFSLSLFILHEFFNNATESWFRNRFGMTYFSLGLHGLAFEDFGRAARQGANVAVANRASMLLADSNAAAALEQLKSVEGQVNSEDPSFEYQLRQRAEDALKTERTRRSTILAHGRRQFYQLTKLCSELLAEPQKEPSEHTLQTEEKTATLTRGEALPLLFTGASSEHLLLARYFESSEEAEVLKISPKGTYSWLQARALSNPAQ